MFFQVLNQKIQVITMKKSLVFLAVAVVFGAILLVEQKSQGKLASLAVGPKKYMKGNLHTHSLWSDGDDYPDMIGDWYKSHGYQFLALTEHNLIAEGEKWKEAFKGEAPKAKALEKYLKRFGEKWVEVKEIDGKKQVRLKTLAECRQLLEEEGKFKFISSEEITHKFAKNPIHMNAINIQKTIKPVDGPSIRETIQVNLRNVQQQSNQNQKVAIGFLNHPNFQKTTPAEDMAACEELRYFEVYNGHPTVRNKGDKDVPSCERLWDIANSLRIGKLNMPILYAVATDDSHTYHEYGLGKVNPGRGWVMVRSDKLKEEDLLMAMNRGDFYASNGVELEEVTFENGTLSIKVKAQANVQYRTQFIGTLKGAVLDGQPVLDKDGQPVVVSRTYGADVGQVLNEVDGANPIYKMNGRELYVRAKVISTKAHPNPAEKGDMETAWTQPVVPLAK
jgi:hypothetical protein